MTPEQKIQLVKGLREAANWIEANDLPIQMELGTPPYLNLWCANGDEMAVIAKSFSPFEKHFGDSCLVWINRQFAGLQVQVTAWKDAVCRKIEKRTIKPAQPEILLPAMPEREEVIVEWECPQSILNYAKPKALVDASV